MSREVGSNTSTVDTRCPNIHIRNTSVFFNQLEGGVLRLVAFRQIEKGLMYILIITRKDGEGGGRAASLVYCMGKKINHAKSGQNSI